MIIEPWMIATLGLVVLLFWIFREIKSCLFWTYLWQLKNYHIGRFMAHFETYNGKKTLFNGLFFLKILLFLCLLVLMFPSSVSPLDNYIYNYGAYLLIAIPLSFLVYLVEGIVAAIGIMRRKVKGPKLTAKIGVLLPFIFLPLLAAAVIFARLFLNDIYYPSSWAIFELVPFAFISLAFDILTPLVVSLIILLFQPITVILRGRILRRAERKRSKLENLLTIGITGSYGKSSVKEFLKTILSGEFKVVATSKNHNSEIGIAECILKEVKEDDEVFICEMGAYSKGGIKLLCDIAKPKIGILTGINNQHLSTFGSQKNIIKTKFELIDSLPEEGLAVLNWDSDFIKDNFKSKVSSIKYSLHGKEDIWAEEIKEGKENISFKAVSKTGESHEFSAKLMGIQNIPNLLAAIAVGRKLGMQFSDIAKKVLEIKPEQGGMKILKSKDGYNVIDATYSSNSDGLSAHLDYLKHWEGRKILVMPCLIELGRNGKETHYKLGRKIGEVCDMVIITSRDYFKQIKKGAMETGMKDENIVFLDGYQAIYDKIIYCIRETDVIFLESRVPSKLMDKLINND